MRRLLSMTLVAMAIPTAVAGQAENDIQAVTAAAYDYIDAFYEGDSTRIHRSVHPEVTKYGFFRPSEGSPYRGTAMSFRQMIEFTENVAARGQAPDPDWPRDVEVLDVMDQMATVKVSAWWGYDYLQLAKYDGRWKIIHVLWQSPPGGS